MPEEMQSIINRIKTRRLELDYSFQELADLTGMSKSTLQRYETGGIKNLPLDRLKILANALDVSPEWIMGWDFTKRNKDDHDNCARQATSQYYLDEETIKKVVEIYDDKESRVLLDAKRDLGKEDLAYIIGLIKRLKKTK